MDDAWVAAGDVQFLAAERFDLRVLVERLVEHVEAHLRCFQHIERLHDDYVHQAVAHRGLRCDVGVVAILRSIGARDEEGLVLLGSCLVFQGICLRLILQALAQDVFRITDRSTLAALRKLHAHEGVESHSAGAEEGVVVDDPVVEVVDFALVDDLDAFLQVHGQEQMASQSVARTARQDAEGGAGVNQRTSHLVDGSVAAYSHDNIDMIVPGFGCKLRSVSRSFSQFYLVLKKLFVQCRIYQTRNGSLAACPRNRVHDENYLFLHS